jgi:hypothetical protein
MRSPSGLRLILTTGGAMRKARGRQIVGEFPDIKTLSTVVTRLKCIYRIYFVKKKLTAVRLRG